MAGDDVSIGTAEINSVMNVLNSDAHTTHSYIHAIYSSSMHVEYNSFAHSQGSNARVDLLQRADQ